MNTSKETPGRFRGKRAALIVLAFFCAAFVSWGPAVNADLRDNVRGDCEIQAPGSCKHQGWACTITVKGDAKAGKCRSQNVMTLGAICVCEPDDGTSVEGTVGTTQSAGAIPLAPATVTFVVLAGDADSVALPPDGLGEGMVEFLTGSGSITLQSSPTGDPNVDNVQVISGMFQAPSLQLPFGEWTGPNTFEMLPAGGPQGTLNRLTGEFTFWADGQVTNDLYPPSNPIPTVGEYFGTVNMATGKASFNTRTFDYAPPRIIPTVSQWGLIVLTLLLLTGATIVFARRRKTATA